MIKENTVIQSQIYDIHWELDPHYNASVVDAWRKENTKLTKIEKDNTIGIARTSTSAYIP